MLLSGLVKNLSKSIIWDCQQIEFIHAFPLIAKIIKG